MSTEKNTIGCCIKQDSKTKLTYIHICDLKGKVSDIIHEYNFNTRHNNRYRRELLSVIKVLEIFPDEDEIMFVIDSKYITNIISRWLPEWEKNGFDKDCSLPNRDLLEKLIQDKYKRIRFIM